MFRKITYILTGDEPRKFEIRVCDLLRPVTKYNGLENRQHEENEVGINNNKHYTLLK